MIMIIKFIFNFCNFSVIFLTRLLTLGILFSKVVNAVFVNKLVTSGILAFISLDLESYSVFLTRPLVSGILFSNSDFASYFMFLKQICQYQYYLL